MTVESEYNESASELHHAADEMNKANERFEIAKVKFERLSKEFKDHKQRLALEAEIEWSRKQTLPDF